jgi:hypothetical protein
MGVLATAAFGASAQAENFVQAAWLCVSPEAYDDAVNKQAGLEGEAFQELRESLPAAKSCTFLENQDFLKIITPVRILETRGERVRVMFTLQVGDQMPAAQRRESFYRMTMWTGRDRLSWDE